MKRLLAVLMLLCLMMTIPAWAESAQEPLRVAVLDYPRYSAIDENGRPTGLAMDYLAALAAYTGWTYEYVPLTLDEARAQLESGGIDLMPGRSHSFSDTALYGDKSMGSAICVLVCRSDDDRYAFQDYESFTDMRVGMLAGSNYHAEMTRMERAMGFKVQSVLYDTHAQCMDALHSGEVDALLMLNIRRDESVKEIARFGSTDLYMAVTPTRPELLDTLNLAQEQLYSDDPFCMLNWWETYYSDTLVSLNLTRAEINYLAQMDTLRVGFLEGVPVYAYTDEEGSFTGIAPDMMQAVADQLGITLTIHGEDSVQQLLDMLYAGELDIILPLHTTDDVILPENVQVLPFFSAELAMVGKTSDQLDSLDALTVALSNDAPLLKQIAEASLGSNEQVVTCQDTHAALDAVQRGEVNAAIAMELALAKMLERPIYDDLTIYPVYTAPLSLSMGLRTDTDPVLVSVLEKTIASLPEETLEQATIRHTIGTPYHMTLSDVLYAFRQPLIISLALVVTIVSAIIAIVVMAFIHRHRLEDSRKALESEMQQRQALEDQREKDELHREELQFLATHDPLTGLYNLNGFEIATRRMLDEHPETDFKIVRMDINSFKIFSDLFGDSERERVLLAIARRFDERANSSVTYARLGNDHFVTCMPAMVDVDVLNQQETLWLRELTPGYDLTPCFGEYRITDRNMSIAIMCDRAMAAMLTVKHLYPPKVGHYTDELRQTLLDEQWITANMRSALDRGEFIPYFQPQYHLYTGQITGAEVLVRWRSPERGFVTPDKFIPLFEKNGFITEMDQYLWDIACRWLRQHIDKGNPPIALSINASRLDVRNLDLPTLLPALVEKYRLPPSLIRLEITESAYMQDPDQLIRTMSELQEAGFTIEMDDFGSGYSSLNLLKDVPVDVLKLDMRFLSQGDAYGRSASIIRSVVNMSKWLNLHVIAEGIEDQQQTDFLKSVGCTHGQGYYFSRPIPMADFETLLHQAHIIVADERQHTAEAALPDRSLPIGTRQCILIVDDKEVRRSMLRSILGDTYDFLEVDSGEKALALLNSGFIPDCILLDSDMPGLDGYQVLEAIRARPETRDLLVIMLVPLSGEREVTLRGLDFGVSDFITAPFLPEMVRHRVRNQLLLKNALLQAQTDGLTGLLNRTAFRHSVENALKTQEGSPAQGMIITLDMDNFKIINDRYGHPFGDKALVAFADSLTTTCGERAIIGRLGGDEFGVLIPDLSSRTDMERLARTILERAHAIVIDGRENVVSCSLGAAVYPADFVRRAELYAAADKALYAAKQTGSGHMMFYDELPRS